MMGNRGGEFKKKFLIGAFLSEVARILNVVFPGFAGRFLVETEGLC